MNRIEGGWLMTEPNRLRGHVGKPLITIITVTKNMGNGLLKTIKSVADQTYPNIEHIVVDGASDDNTLEVLNEHNSVIAYWLSEPDSGTTDGFNKAMARARGDLIICLPAEDYIECEFTNKLVQAYNADPNADYFYGKVCYFNSAGDSLFTVIDPVHFLHGVKKEVFHNLGALDSDYEIANDYEYYLRMLHSGMKSKYFDATMYMLNGGRSERKWLNSYIEARRAEIKYGSSEFLANIRFIMKLFKMGSRIIIAALLGQRRMLSVRSKLNKKIAVSESPTHPAFM